MKTMLRYIDNVSEWAGKLVAWLILPLVLFTVMEVVLRYVFNSPTVWAWDVNIQLMLVFIALGGAYALLYGTHVSVDILVSKLSQKRKALVDAITGPIFLTAISLMLWKVSLYSLNSVLIMEHYTSTWFPPIYPAKVLMTIGVLLLLLQGIAKWIRDLMTVMHTEVVEGQ